MSTLKNKDAREIGAEWLCKQSFDQLGIGSFLQQAGWDEDKIAVATIRYQLKEQRINSYWREIVRTMNTQKCVTTSLVNIKNETISIRQCTEPTQEMKKIYDLLKYKYAPFVRKKSVDPPAELFKNDSP